MLIELSAASNAQNLQATEIETLKPSRMNRFQRSLVKDRVSAVAKDTTSNVASFLSDTAQILRAYLQRTTSASTSWKPQKRALASLLRFWWDTFNLAISKNFEEDTFQAHLAIGTDLLSNINNDVTDAEYRSLVRSIEQSIQQDFTSGFRLTTGLCMEVLWKRLRPAVISSRSVLENLMQLEQLAARFDALKWKTSISVSDLGNIMTSLVKAYKTMLTSDVNGAELIRVLDGEMEKLESSMGRDEDSITPFLGAQFEALRQYKTLKAMELKQSAYLVDTDIVVLANHPTPSQFRLKSATTSSWLTQNIDGLLGSNSRLIPIRGTLVPELLAKINNIDEVDLKSLKLLEAELPTIAEKMAGSSATFDQDQIFSLNGILSSLILQILSTQSATSEIEVSQLQDTLKSDLVPDNMAFMFASPAKAAVVKQALSILSTPSQLEEVYTTHIIPSLIASSTPGLPPDVKLQISSLAWVHFAIGCLTLYVPDRAFDPDKRQRLELERHSAARVSLENKLAALKHFERQFSGQDSNLRCQLLEEEILDLGTPPQILQEIYRPAVSEMNQLQGEFTNLLKTIVMSDVPAIVTEYFKAGEESQLQQIKLTQNNVTQIMRRLSERFRAYNDLTAPVVNMLRALQIGLSIATMVSTKQDSKPEASLELSRMTPFLGGGPLPPAEDMTSSQPMEYLSLIATTSAVENLSTFGESSRRALLTSFHGCFDQWSERLESDRIEAESKTGLYRFRGSAEDEDEDDQEQFNQLFPAYEEASDETANTKEASTQVRDTSVAISKLHAEIFLQGRPATESLNSLIRNISTRIGSLHNNESHVVSQSVTSELLPGALLLLDDHIESLSPTAIISDSYNFYTDANLPEARKLVALIHQIQSRFRELQAVDEIGHMQPLEDVLVSCRELLQFRHIEPLAKVITKVEKVHTFMHEWQFGGWASRANSALVQYDNLTQTIVNWRRLELSTWAKLFDMETKQCDDDARSWFFVAYKVIVAAPLQNSDKPEMLKDYAQKLLKDLETYFSTAILGQYVQRLQLLKQLSKHLEMIVIDLPNMAIVLGALKNFISLYAQYEKPVKENMKRGKVALEKSMKDVLLLASWKDTNIVALRDSAKRSHHKLFKIVRKFRSLLGQPMDSIIKQGLPEETSVDEGHKFYEIPMPFPNVDLSALALCAESVPNWSQKSKRFVNVSKTVSMMADAASLPAAVVEGWTYLDSFLGNIITSTAELQKATPNLLTEDNKDKVKHLKSRKRKLFADTLKELRRMGFKFNLGANALAKQDSLSVVLANVGVVDELSIQGMQYYFLKAVDLAPKVREAVRQHSEDLSSAEVARSIGFLEGILQVLLAQRNNLSSTATDVKELDTMLKMVKGLWAPKQYDIQLGKLTSDHERVLRWLPNILAVAVDLIKIHSKLGKTDSKDVQNFVASWNDRFISFAMRLDHFSSLPDHVVATNRLELLSEVDEAVRELNSELLTSIEKHPDLAFITRQILPWTKVTVSERTHQFQTKTIADLDQKLSTVCDSVLVAIEQHKKSIADIPTSTEDAAWLAKNEDCFSASIKALHCSDIFGQMKEAFGILRSLNLDDTAISKTAGACFAVALPLLQQYFNTLENTVTRYGQLHRATCKTSYILSKTFIQIATQGFCTPSEKSANQDGQTEKLEGGTGLGDGEGAEDISKDIQDDEDLDELAQEPNKEKDGEIEDEKDAVDMADGEMEGEMGDAEEKEDDDKGSGDESGEENEMDEEAGDVDDLDPTAVDEKMWDGDGEQAEKDQEGDDSKGKQDKSEQAATQENGKDNPEGEDGDEGEDEEEIAGAEQGEEVKQDEVEKHDPHAQEGEALDLPEDMELDGDDEEGSVGESEDGLNDLSDAEDTKEEGDEVANDGKEEEGAEDMDAQDNDDIVSEMDVVDLDQDSDGEGEQTEEAGEKVDEEDPDQEPEDQEGLLHDRDDEASADVDNAVPSDAQGVGEDQDDNAKDDNAESANKAQREEGGKGGESSEKKDSAAEDGEKGRQANGDAPQNSQDDTQDSSDAQPFKKLGDALEKWHRQQTKIREASDPKDKEQGQDQGMDMDKETSEFQHLQDEEAEADTQALGTATEDQAHTLDESMAVDSESKDMPEQFQPDEVEDDGVNHDDAMDLEEESKEQEASDAYEGRAGAQIHQANQDLNDLPDDPRAHSGEDKEDDDVEEVDVQLSSTHLDPSSFQLVPLEQARSQWTHYEALTRSLSLSLTEQLRLILAPTLATKMRGDFRTGKRLNIKRIIPYIASQYKRDKIWMRRSVPSKRSYQIMLAVDDSKSMGESGSGSLALETLVMVSKSLSMLEVGEICVVGFGEEVKIAHDFNMPFSSDAGPAFLQNFTFAQNTTNIKHLVQRSIDLFRTARNSSTASASSLDLWQLQLIISDGVCDASEHDNIRRLLREALEERIMIVFVIVDDVRKKGKGESVLDLRKAEFVDGKLRIERYLDTFPFQYYLVVGDVTELPGVLATLLRQWFAEVVDSS